MPMLSPTQLRATARFQGINENAKDLSTTIFTEVGVNYGGFVRGSHSGVTRTSCVRLVSQYPKAALNKRGVTLWVEHSGFLKKGDALSLHMPPIRTWRLTD